MARLKSVGAILLVVYMTLFTACISAPNNLESAHEPSQEAETNQSSQALQDASDPVLTEEERVERENLIVLGDVMIDKGTSAMAWWLGDIWAAFDLSGATEPSYLDTYYLVTEFDSIAQLKQETEKVFTKQFAEENLYFRNGDPETARFVEHEGKLYIRDIGGWGLPFGPIKNYTVKSLSEDECVIAATVFNFRTNEDITYDFVLVKTDTDSDDINRGWRLNTYFLYSAQQ